MIINILFYLTHKSLRKLTNFIQGQNRIFAAAIFYALATLPIADMATCQIDQAPLNDNQLDIDRLLEDIENNYVGELDEEKESLLGEALRQRLKDLPPLACNMIVKTGAQYSFPYNIVAHESSESRCRDGLCDPRTYTSLDFINQEFQAYPIGAKRYYLPVSAYNGESQGGYFLGYIDFKVAKISKPWRSEYDKYSLREVMSVQDAASWPANKKGLTSPAKVCPNPLNLAPGVTVPCQLVYEVCFDPSFLPRVVRFDFDEESFRNDTTAPEIEKLFGLSNGHFIDNSKYTHVFGQADVPTYYGYSDTRTWMKEYQNSEENKAIAFLAGATPMGILPVIGTSLSATHCVINHSESPLCLLELGISLASDTGIGISIFGNSRAVKGIGAASSKIAAVGDYSLAFLYAEQGEYAQAAFSTLLSGPVDLYGIYANQRGLSIGRKVIVDPTPKRCDKNDSNRITVSKVVSDTHPELFRHKGISLKKLFPGFNEDLFIGIQDGHAFLLVDGLRYDSSFFMLKRNNFRPNSVIKNREAALIKFNDIDLETKEKIKTLARRNNGSRMNVTCSYGTCEVLQSAGFDIPKYLIPSNVLKGLSSRGISLDGQPVDIEIFLIKEGSYNNFYSLTLRDNLRLPAYLSMITYAVIDISSSIIDQSETLFLLFADQDLSESDSLVSPEVSFLEHIFAKQQ